MCNYYENDMNTCKLHENNAQSDCCYFDSVYPFYLGSCTTNKEHFVKVFGVLPKSKHEGKKISISGKEGQLIKVKTKKKLIRPHFFYLLNLK